MPSNDIKESSASLIHFLAGEQADLFLHELWLPAFFRSCGEVELHSLRACLSDPFIGLKAIYSKTAFARRGKDRNTLGDIAVSALERTAGTGGFEQFLSEPNAASLWQNFEGLCACEQRKPFEQLNKGVVAGIAELAQEIYRLDGRGSIPDWIAQGVLQTGRLEPQFTRMVDVRGIGPKLSSVLMRDVVFTYGLEAKVEPLDRPYIQPINKFTRLAAPEFIHEPDIERAADWILAGKIAKYARLADVSGIRLNMGCTYYKMQHGRQPNL